MKGYHKRKSESNTLEHARQYRADHPLYDYCTLYKHGSFGLAVVQRLFNDSMKVTWWGPVEPWLANDIFNEPSFMDVFMKLSGPADEKGIYPTIEVRKLMHKLGMKPLKLPYWEKDIS